MEDNEVRDLGRAQSMTKTKSLRLKELHRYYQITGFYNFLIKGLKKAILPTLALIAAALFIHFFVFALMCNSIAM